MLGKFMKSTEVAMQDAILLKQELHQLRTSSKHQKEKKNMTRAFIQDGGSLTDVDAQTAQAESSRPRRPAQCSNCNQEGHNRLKCPLR